MEIVAVMMEKGTRIQFLLANSIFMYIEMYMYKLSKVASYNYPYGLGVGTVAVQLTHVIGEKIQMGIKHLKKKKKSLTQKVTTF